MPPTSVADLFYVNSIGVFVADYPTFLLYLTTQYQNIYGIDVYLQPDSQDGQWIAVLAQALYQTAQQAASVYNSFSPVTAQGVGLSRVVKINGLSRLVPSFSTVTLTIVGTANTVITNGIAADSLNQQWILPTTVTIPSGGTIDVIATAQLIGFVTAAEDTVTTVFTPTLGWQTVNNAAPATPGAAVETDAALRIRQAASTSISAETVFDATLGGVSNVTGVTKVYGYENYTGSTDGNSLPPHSICVAVVGGAEQDIANTITVYKTPGTQPFGNTGPIATVDARGMPLDIYFTIPITAEIKVTVTGSQLTGWSSAYEAQIQNAVAASINALRIGAVVVYTALFVSAYLVGTPAYGTFEITGITIGKNSGMQSAMNIVLANGANAENPVCNPTTDVTITIT